MATVKTGVDTAAGLVNYWNPTTGRYESAPYSWDNWSKGTNEKSKYSWYDNGLGQYVYGLKPPATHQVITPGTDFGHTRAGSDPNWKPTINPDDHGINPDGSTRNPITNAADWMGSSSHDKAGNIIPGGGADTGTWGPGGSKNWVPVDNSWDWSKFQGNRGTQTVDSGGLPTTGSGLSGKAPPSAGQKGPWLPGATNDEYYSRQFRAITEQRNAHQAAQAAAALRAQQAASAAPTSTPTDWSWARGGKGLPQVQVATGSTLQTPAGGGPTAAPGYAMPLVPGV